MSKQYDLSKENQILHSENRKLRERLLELYSQINTLSSLSENLNVDLNKLTVKQNNSDYFFVLNERTILPTGAIYSASLSPVKDLIALAGFNGSINIVSSSLKQIKTIQAHSQACRDLYWGSSGLISCGFDKLLKIWDVEKDVSQDYNTGGLCHAVCGLRENDNSIFAASGKKIFWIDKRRDTPVTISTPSKTTAVCTYKNYIIYGEYDGHIRVVDKRSLQSNYLYEKKLDNSPISSFSRVLSSGVCVITTTTTKPVLLKIEENKFILSSLQFEKPTRFGTRADIIEKNIIFSGEFATVCGGRMGSFADGYSQPIPLEDIGGFDYGAIFISNLAQKVLTYSEDGTVTVYSLAQK